MQTKNLPFYFVFESTFTLAILHNSLQMKYILLTIMLFLTELLIALFVKDSFVRPFFGDFLATIFVYTGLRILTDNWIKAAFASLIISYAVETLQYFRFIHITGLSKFKVLSVILGTSFSWWDMLAYTAGFLAILIWESEALKTKVSLN